jgi:hypothetical protein
MGSRSRGRNTTRSSRPSGALTWRAYRRPGRRSSVAMQAAETTWANTESASSPTTRPRSSRGRRRNARCSRGEGDLLAAKAAIFPRRIKAARITWPTSIPEEARPPSPDCTLAGSSKHRVPHLRSPIRIAGSCFQSIRYCATVFGAWEETSGESRLTAHLDLVVGAAAPVAEGVP